MLTDEAMQQRVKPEPQLLLKALVCFCLPLPIQVHSRLEILIAHAQSATIVRLQPCTQQALCFHKACKLQVKVGGGALRV